MPEHTRTAGDDIGTGDATTRDAVLTTAVERSLGRFADRAAGLIATLRAGGVGLDAFEASLRGEAGAISGARMMLERQASAAASAQLAALGIAPGDAGTRLLAFAERHKMPVISGWDGSGRELLGKLYLNASDASLDVRKHARDTLAPGRGGPPAPHVIGLNLGVNDTELKLYEQRRELAADAPPALHELDALLRARGHVAGVVVSHRVGRDQDIFACKAHFLALRPGTPSDSITSRLAGWDEGDAAALAPLARGEFVSLGFSARGDVWTLYFKPRANESLAWSLDPLACFATPAGEIGLYVEPRAHAQRSYRVIGDAALSYRLRAGAVPDPADIERLVDWIAPRITASRDKGQVPRENLLRPPAPWRLVKEHPDG